MLLPRAFKKFGFVDSDNSKIYWLGELGGEADHDRPHIKVADCPCLASLSLSPTRWWNLELSGLPRFTDLESESLQVNDADAVAPAIQAAVLRDLPSLRKLQLASCGLQSLVVDDCPLLRELSLNPGQMTCSNCNHPQGDRTCSYRIRCNAAENNLKSLLSGQQWLQQLRILDLNGNRLADADLSYLCNLSGLEQLLLDDTDASIASLVSDVKHSKLQYLSIRREQVSSNELKVLLNAFPGLSSLHLDATLSGKLELVDRYNLKLLKLRHLQSVDEVTIQNCPLLEVSLCFSHPLEKLHIENVPKIQELYVAHPVPRDTVLKGVRQLKECYLSGEHVADHHVEELSRCRDLDLLFLEAPRVSPVALSKLRACERLSVLLMPSTPVDDHAMQALCSLKNICELDLTRTAISKDSLKVVAKFQQLQKLFLVTHR